MTFLKRSGEPAIHYTVDDFTDPWKNALPEVSKSMSDPEIKESLAGNGAIPIASTPDQFRAFLAAETAKWAVVVKAAGIQPE